MAIGDHSMTRGYGWGVLLPECEHKWTGGAWSEYPIRPPLNRGEIKCLKCERQWLFTEHEEENGMKVRSYYEVPFTPAKGA